MERSLPSPAQVSLPTFLLCKWPHLPREFHKMFTPGTCSFLSCHSRGEVVLPHTPHHTAALLRGGAHWGSSVFFLLILLARVQAYPGAVAAAEQAAASILAKRR